jgi:hypothetical protein
MWQLAPDVSQPKGRNCSKCIDVVLEGKAGKVARSRMNREIHVRSL